MGNLPSEKTLVLFCFLPFSSFHATWPGSALSPSTLALSSFSFVEELCGTILRWYPKWVWPCRLLRALYPLDTVVPVRKLKFNFTFYMLFFIVVYEMASFMWINRKVDCPNMFIHQVAVTRMAINKLKDKILKKVWVLFDFWGQTVRWSHQGLRKGKIGYRGLNHPKSGGAHPVVELDYRTKSSKIRLVDVLKVFW